MAKGEVNFILEEQRIGRGTLVLNDSVSGLLFDISGGGSAESFWGTTAGKAAKEKLDGVVLEISSLDEAHENGITASVLEKLKSAGVDENALLNGVAEFHIDQFFSQFRNMVTNTAIRPLLYVMFADCSENFDAIVQMQRAANGAMNQIGVWTEQSLWQNVPGSDKYSVRLVAKLNEAAATMANDEFAPASVLLCANSAKLAGEGIDGDEAYKVDLKKIPTCVSNFRYVTVLLGQSKDERVRRMQGGLVSKTPVGTLGVALATVASLTPGRSLAWVAECDISAFVSDIELGFGNATASDDTGLIVNATDYVRMSRKQIDDLDDKGYVTLCKYAQNEGRIYFTKDHTCSNADFNTIARNKVINKSRRLVRGALLPSVNGPVEVDATTGYLLTSTATEYATSVENALSTMLADQNIVAIGAIDVPVEQDVLRSGVIELTYGVVPFGCSEEFRVTEGLSVSQ